MRIFLPDTKDYHRSEGPGGYKREKVVVDINKFVDNFSFYLITIPKGKQADAHRHQESHELFYALTPMKTILNGKEKNLPVGTLAIAEPGDTHYFDATDAEIKYIAIKIPSNPNDKIFN